MTLRLSIRALLVAFLSVMTSHVTSAAAPTPAGRGAPRIDALSVPSSTATRVARAAILNGRGKGALQKMGAVQEGVLRQSLYNSGHYLDQALYAIVDEEWRVARQVAEEDARLLDPSVH